MYAVILKYSSQYDVR